MFENMIGQERIVNRIKSEITNSHLSSAILFAGDESSGKLTAALELSRILTCQYQADWNCGCHECQKHRVLSSHKVIIIGKRNFIPEIQSALAFGAEDQSSLASRFIMIRSIHKLTSRFHPELNEAHETALKKASSLLEQMTTLISPVYPGTQNSWYSEKWAKKVIDIAIKIEQALPDKISVNTIRAINQWSHQSGNANRSVIIENADKLSLSASNALLKSLEEPPAGLTFILLTSRRGAIIPTILSRVRLYLFASRGTKSQQEVLKRVFRVKEPLLYSSIKDYLYDISGLPINIFEKYIRTLLHLFDGDDSFFNDDYQAIYDEVNSKPKFKLFLEKLIQEIRLAGCEGSEFTHCFSTHQGEYWNSLIREAWLMNSSYNQSFRSLLETLFARMGEPVLNHLEKEKF